MVLDLVQKSQCLMQAKLFEISAQENLGSEAFMKTFMTSQTAADLDKEFHFMQWAGEAYILSRLKEENASQLKVGELFDKETLYWAGYLYRYWHFYTGESSKDIVRQAPPKIIKAVYLMYHSMSCEMAIDRLKETYQDKHKK